MKSITSEIDFNFTVEGKCYEFKANTPLDVNDKHEKIVLAEIDRRMALNPLAKPRVLKEVNSKSSISKTVKNKITKIIES